MLLTLSLVIGAVLYSWLDSIDYNIHKNSRSIASARQALRPAPANYGYPINILILGSDKRYNENGDTGRSDTLMIMRVDYKKKRVYLISIPRDCRVRIPGLGSDKINAAYAYGGPRLSIQTVELLTGLEINHYVQIDFRGFKKMVDALGGVDVEVKETINNRSRGYSMYIPKGKHRMNGALALNYVRYRHGDNDFKRAERQQNFLSALTNNVLRWNSVWKIPRLINILAKNIETDLSMNEMSKLAGFLRGVKENDIESVTIPGRSGMQNGISYVYPNNSAIATIVETMEDGKSLKKLKSQLESGKMMLTNKDVSVSILNGSGTKGMALNAKEVLSNRGFDIVSVGTAANSNYLTTEIMASAQNMDKAKKVKNMLIKTAIIKKSPQRLSTDVLVIVGKDYTLSERTSTR